MTEAAQTFLTESRCYLRDEYPASIGRAILSLTDEQIWWRPNEGSNSIGNLILHLTGNVRHWIVAGVGRQPNERNRQQEFDERRKIPKHELLAYLKTVLAEADAVLANLQEGELSEARQIQGSDTTVMKAIFHVVEHFSIQPRASTPARYSGSPSRSLVVYDDSERISAMCATEQALAVDSP